MDYFAYPLLLLLLPLAPLAAWWWWRQNRGAVRFSDTALLADLPAGRSRLARWAGAAFRGAALLFLILALAGPRWPIASRITTEGIAIEMVLDVSGSMAELDFSWQGRPIGRLEALKNAFRLFVGGGDGPGNEHFDGRPQDLIGLVTFASWPESACPPTLSHSVLLKLLDAEQPRRIPTESRTNIGDALAWGLQRLEKTSPKRKVMILLTDGEHNIPPPALTPRQAAQLAANLRIPVYVIDAGGEGSAETEEGKSRAEIRASAEKTLRSVAAISGGRYFRASDATELLNVYREIDALERDHIRSFLYRHYRDDFMWFGLTSFVFLLSITFLEQTLWRRLP